MSKSVRSVDDGRAEGWSPGKNLEERLAPGRRMHDSSKAGDWNCHDGSIEEPLLDLIARFGS